MYLEAVDPGRREELAYRVSEIPVPVSQSNLMSSTTVIEPGKVGEEYS
jgi:hypothetical protein